MSFGQILNILVIIGICSIPLICLLIYNSWKKTVNKINPTNIKIKPKHENIIELLQVRFDKGEIEKEEYEEMKEILAR